MHFYILTEMIAGVIKSLHVVIDNVVNVAAVVATNPVADAGT